MRGDSGSEAVEKYASAIRKPLSCVTTAFADYRGGTFPSDAPHVFTFTGTPPIGRLNGTRLAMFFSQQYSVVKGRGRAEWKVKTLGYMYRLDDEGGQELISYHWHPLTGDIPYPHMHVERTEFPQIQKGHMPTGRIAIESFVEYLIHDWDVQPIKTNWQKILETNRNQFEEFKSW